MDVSSGFPLGVMVASGAQMDGSVRGAFSVAVMKKTMDMQKQMAAQLLEALPQQRALPDNVGRNINVTA